MRMKLILTEYGHISGEQSTNFMRIPLCKIN